MKRWIICVGFLCACSGFAELTYDYTDKAGVFDGKITADVDLSDSGINFTMTVTSSGGNLNSNSEDFGIGDAFIDGQIEIITLSFDTAIDFTSIEFGGVGGSVDDGVRLTVGTNPYIDLYTGVTGFEGTPDRYTPASVIRLSAGEFITLTGSSATSSFDLDVPEPATFALVGIGGALAFLFRRRFLK